YKNNKAKILFNEPQMSVAPGQSVVFYSDDIVFGGGIIEDALPL
ncbi:MAG: tRNA 2-thiouridine(34) synthase MnmA, partial [Deltaproteobacteria bacterium]|nr:tRNA 2-thiouridine(34) synthase MnmA [Deltaproteobacteria bacterium]